MTANFDNVCMNCLTEVKKVTIEIDELGYGSGFDGWGTRLQLCRNCYDKTNPKWWELNIKRNGFNEEYEFETEIFAYVNKLPIIGKELFYNKFIFGWNAHAMKSFL